MIYLAVLLAAALVALVLDRRHSDKFLSDRELAWDLERTALRSSLAKTIDAFRLEREGDRTAATALADAQAAERKEWVQERSELLTRIQHPGLVVRPPVAAAGEYPELPDEPDESDLVGQIVNTGAASTDA